MRYRHQCVSIAAVLAIGAYFLYLTREATRGYFDADACMNIYRSWDAPVTSLIKANLLFFESSPFYRPFGSAWYRALYWFAGFDPAPYVVATLAVLAANIWLTYMVTRRLTGLKEAGVLAALLISYHGAFGALYFDLGFSYDVLCYFFFFAILTIYLRARQSGRAPSWREVAVCCALYVCALNSKELAVTLPAVLVVYEWLFHFRSERRFDWRLPAVIAVMTAAFAAGRALGSDSLMAMTAYQPQFSLHRWMQTNGNFLGGLFFRVSPLGPAVVLCIYAAMLIIARMARSKSLLFAWLFVMLTPIPVAFILPRGPAQYYVPFFGWVLFAAEGLVWLSGVAFRGRLASVRPAALFLTTASAMFALNARHGLSTVSAVAVDGELLRSVVEQMHRLQPALPEKARVLFLDDPIDDKYRLMFLMQLSYGAPGIVIDRARYMEKYPDAATIASYDFVFDYRLGRFFAYNQPRPRGDEPVVVLDHGRPEVYHTDWTRVTRQHPARRGEAVIAMAANLGVTQPPVPVEQPFPSDPLVIVAARVDVRLRGEPGEVLLEIGWPAMVNRYRVDFRIPAKIPAGEAEVVLVCRGLTGPGIPIAVE